MNVLDTFEDDETYKFFLSSEYDAEKYANSIIASSTVSQTLQALQVCCLSYHLSSNNDDAHPVCKIHFGLGKEYRQETCLRIIRGSHSIDYSSSEE
jgi:hypothetical protein